MEAKLKETKLKLENSGEIRHTLVLWNQIISGIFRVQAWETKKNKINYFNFKVFLTLILDIVKFLHFYII
jgi:hypothetical protein